MTTSGDGGRCEGGHLLKVSYTSTVHSTERQAIVCARSDVGCLTAALVIMSSLYPKKSS